MFYHLVNLGHQNCSLPTIFAWLGIRRMLCPYFDHTCWFQALLHHCFVRLLKHLDAILGREKVYSLDFRSTTTRRNLSITFWEGRELVTMTIAHCGRDVPVMKSTVLLSSQVFSAVSTEPRIICCGGSSLEFIKALDKAPHRKPVSSIRLVCLLCISRS